MELSQEKLTEPRALSERILINKAWLVSGRYCHGCPYKRPHTVQGICLPTLRTKTSPVSPNKSYPHYQKKPKLNAKALMSWQISTEISCILVTIAVVESCCRGIAERLSLALNVNNNLDHFHCAIYQST